MTPLLERDAELEGIVEAFGRARSGAGAVLLVDGAAGIGKTALLDLSDGALVSPASIGEPEVVPGFSRLGLKLAPGQVPVSALPGGSPVVLV